MTAQTTCGPNLVRMRQEGSDCPLCTSSNSDASGEARLRWLGEQMLYLGDEWREEWESRPDAGPIRCPVHRKPVLGDEQDPDSSAICPLCVVADRVRKLARAQSRLEVVR